MEEVSETLVELGLTKAQATLLVALFKLKKATVKELEKATGVYRQQIYPSIVELHESGLIEKNLGTPAYYRALPPSHILEVLIKRNRKRLLELEKEKEKLRKIEQEEKTLQEKTEEYEFTLITGMKRFGNALAKWNKDAKTMDVVVKIERFNEEYTRELEISKTRLRKDLKIRIVVDSMNHFKSLNPAIVRVSPMQIPVSAAIYNGNRAHLVLYSASEYPKKDNVVVLTSNHPYFVKMVQSYFDIFWDSANEEERKIKRKTTE
ncbi:MAG: hypothetical protein NWE95_02175 [Candidatus Bathyarchaeota archaeon]|nr:hypothetical protein [Candidatus Bathyarchaeota archaeon]